MHRLFLVLVCLLCSALPSFAQTVNLCTVTPASMVVNPNTVYVELPDFNTTYPDGKDHVASVTVAAFAKGVVPSVGAPITEVTIPRTALAPVSGVPNCYKADLTQPLAVPIALEHQSAVKKVNHLGSSGWTLGNPFYVASAPSASPNFKVR